jgi:predicted protein tyrosine phosphatase
MFPLQPSAFRDPPTNAPFAPPFNIIIPHLYIGSVKSLDTASLFGLIVNCTRHIPLSTTIESIRVAVHDHPEETDDLMKAIKETQVLENIHKARLKGRNVLVHCHAGIQRSCTIVAMYLMKYHNMTPDQIFRFLPTRRPVAFLPKPTFRKAIYQFYTDSTRL